jgi:hypothetical protein
MIELPFLPDNIMLACVETLPRSDYLAHRSFTATILASAERLAKALRSLVAADAFFLKSSSEKPIHLNG